MDPRELFRGVSDSWPRLRPTIRSLSTGVVARAGYVSKPSDPGAKPSPASRSSQRSAGGSGKKKKKSKPTRKSGGDHFIGLHEDEDDATDVLSTMESAVSHGGRRGGKARAGGWR